MISSRHIFHSHLCLFMFQLSGDYGNNLLKEVEEEPEEEERLSVKEEISSLTKQFEKLNQRASEELPVRPQHQSPLHISSPGSSVTSAILDVNKNTRSDTKPLLGSEDSGKIKQVNILPARDNQHRFKSTYNGPMGDYKLRNNSGETSPKQTIPEEESETREPDLPETKLSSPVRPAEVFLPPVPPRLDKTAETVVVSATIETKPETEEEEEKEESPVESEENTPKTSPVKEEVTKKTPIKYQRTKSQEFRDYQHEFMVSSIIDFGPLQPVNTVHTQVTSTPISRPAVRDPSPAESPVRKPGSSTTPAKVSPKTPSPEPPQPVKTSCQMLEFDDEVSPEKTDDNDVNGVVNGSKKTEIKPSDSFLLELNKNNNLDTNPDQTSSDSTPIIDSKKMLPADSRIEQMLSDRTNSLLRKNPTKTADDLLDWAKSILSKFPNVKVTNFTTSWRNGLAFCGLIHSFYPDLISYDTLTPHDIKHNCKLAFEAGEKLGITRLIEPENMVIKRIPDKLAVITYLHQLRSALGTEETDLLYEKSKDEQLVPTTGVKKSWSEGQISLFSRSNTEAERSDLETIEEQPSVEIRPEKLSEYKSRAKSFIEQARSESIEEEGEEQPEEEPVSSETTSSTRGNSSSPPKVIMRQKSNTPKPRNNRLSYFDNEMQMLDAEQHEIDIQAAILDKRLRETSEDDQVLYDALLQQWFTLVNKKNALVKRQMQLNILKKEDNLDKKQNMLQEELRSLSEMEESRKTEDDRKREDLLLQELIELVNKRNELVMQRDEEERMLHDDEQLDEEITLPENNHLRNNRRDECKMQ